MERGDEEANVVGKRVVLQATFTGSPRYLFQNYQDAMAICRYFGFPDLFFTFTCNARWPEIKEALSLISGQKPEDRPDIVSRVFRLKVRHLIKDLMNKNHFGKAVAVTYTVEFKKRGLMHVHILLWLHSDDKCKTAESIDRIISAELPDEDSDSVGYEAVVNFMIHGPCGEANNLAPCMMKNKCSKFFPKQYHSHTFINEDGYPIYKRRDNRRLAVKNGVQVDNRFIVPHNFDLIVKYQSHINVEICSQTKAIKYLFKYINKGTDRTKAVLQTTNNQMDAYQLQVPTIIDEVKMYLDFRYLFAYEACWRFFEFLIHHREPSVQRLVIHLQGQQNVFFNDREMLAGIMNRPDIQNTMFTEWMVTNQQYEEARALLYADFPTQWVWLKTEMRWKKRQIGRSVGRIINVHPTAGELFSLRMVLNVIRGARTYQELRIVNGILCNTFQQACEMLGLLGDDRECDDTLTQASEWATSHQLRKLFTTIILFCQVTDANTLWGKSWKLLSKDIDHRLKQAFGLKDYIIPEVKLRNYVLVALEEIFNEHSTSLSEHKLPC